jgi:hypothetical protein
MSELSSKHINFSAKLMAGILLLEFFFFISLKPQFPSPKQKENTPRGTQRWHKSL